MKRFTETHFIRENAAERVASKEREPGDALFLVGPENGIQGAEGWAIELNGARLLKGFVTPGRRGVGLPTLLGEGGVKEPGLRLADAIAPGVLFGGGIDENLLQLLDGAGVDEGDAPILEPGVVLSTAQQSLSLIHI